MNTNSQYQVLRKEFPRLCFEQIQIKEIKSNAVLSVELRFEYSLQGIGRQENFTTKYILPDISSSDLNQAYPLVRMLGLIESLSYWKLTCSPIIQIKACEISVFEEEWFLRLLRGGMSEYFFKNEIPLDIPVGIERDKSSNEGSRIEKKDCFGAVVLVGGGKDSIVSLELLKKVFVERIATFAMNPIEPSRVAIDLSGYGESIFVSRDLDNRLFELNRGEFLNGHIPFSAVLSAVSTLCAYTKGYAWVFASNESSANEGNLSDGSSQVNHQYSKTFEYEIEFAKLMSYYESPTSYSSFLRPLNELQIAGLFSTFTKYHPIFQSCNVRQTRANKAELLGLDEHLASDRWCSECPKCCFVFLMLSCFLDVDELIAIFGILPSEKAGFIPEVEQLIGQTELKPFECVGTFSESRAALAYALSQDVDNLIYSSELSSELGKFVKDDDLTSFDNLMSAWNDQNLLSPKLSSLLMESLSHVTR